MTTHPIPADALDDRLGYYGTAGSGKTYNAGSGVERLLRAGKRSLTTDGTARAVAMQLQGSLLDTVLARLPGPERRILSAAAAEHPREVSNEEVATNAGYSPTSTGYTNPRSALRTKELITYPSSGNVRAADWGAGPYSPKRDQSRRRKGPPFQSAVLWRQSSTRSARRFARCPWSSKLAVTAGDGCGASADARTAARLARVGNGTKGLAGHSFSDKLARVSRQRGVCPSRELYGWRQ